MQQTRQLVDTLKRCLRARNLTYRDVATQLQLSEASIKRLFSEASFSLERLEAVCTLVDLRIADLCRLSEQQDTTTRELTLAQETALAQSPRLLGVFYRLLSGWNRGRITREQGLEAHEITRLLARLERLDLIDWLPGDRMRLRTARSVRWRRDGPLWRRYAEWVQRDFMQDGFRSKGAHLEFESGELSGASLALVHRKMGRLALEIRELVELDGHLPASERTHVAWLSGIKPWEFAPLFDPT